MLNKLFAAVYYFYFYFYFSRSEVKAFSAA